MSSTSLNRRQFLRAGAAAGAALVATLGPPLPPSCADGFQFFGYVTIDGHTEVMTVSLRDLDEGKELFSVDLTP